MIVVDTGKKGGAIHFDSVGQFKSFFKFKMNGEVFLNLEEFEEWILETNDNDVLIERIPTMPKQSVVSTATQWFHVGAIYATIYLSLHALDYTLRDVYPATWYSAMTRLHNRLEPQYRTQLDKPKYITEAVAKFYFPEICQEYTKRTRVDDALTDCLGMWIWDNIDEYLFD